MFIAMNNFRVVPGREADFETSWRTRESHLDGVPGFLRFHLLRGDAGGEYISMSQWDSRDSFVAWTRSESFAQGHRQGSLAGVLQGPPVAHLYEVVLTEEARAPSGT